MISRKNLCFAVFCMLLGIVGALAAVIIGNGGQNNIGVWELDVPTVYDKQMEKRMEEMQAEELPCMFWTERKGVTVKNLDFARQVKVKTMGIAGNTGVLFPNENALFLGETGYCILGADTAYALFGNRNVVGRAVWIDDKTYLVAGIEFQEPNLCMYELNPEDGQQVEYVAYRYENNRVRSMIEQRLHSAYDIFGVNIKKEKHSML